MAGEAAAQPQEKTPPKPLVAGGKTILKRYVFNGQVVAMRRSGVLYWLRPDHLGSASLVPRSVPSRRRRRDAEGHWLADDRFYPYGETKRQDEASPTYPTDRLFTGIALYASIGIYHMGARFYDAYINRWVSPDIIVPDPANPASLNRYAYALNNPLKFVDPSGNSEEGACDPNDATCSDPSTLWDPTWFTCVGEPEAAEAASLLFLSDPEHFIALYADTEAWNLSKEVADLEVFAGYSLLHTSAEDLLLSGSDPDIADGLSTAHFLCGLDTEVGSRAFSTVVGTGSGFEAVALFGESSLGDSDWLLYFRSPYSEQQMGETGIPIAGAGSKDVLRKAEDLALEYGGAPGDWAKMTSTSYRGPDGYRFETHWYQNVRTGLQVEWKSKPAWLGRPNK